MSWRETSLYLCTASLYLEKVVASKQLKFAMDGCIKKSKTGSNHTAQVGPGDGGRKKSKKGINLI